jgi:hypothetical protein
VSVNGLYVWVEGDNDERFFDAVLLPQVQDIYDFVKIVKYACMKTEKIVAFMDSIASMEASYVFVADRDDDPCVSAAKNRLLARLPNLDQSRLAIVVREIEGWYLAGVPASKVLRYQRRHEDPNEITKEVFEAGRRRRYVSRVGYLIEILRAFDRAAAKSRSVSFAYVENKFFS